MDDKFNIKRVPIKEGLLTKRLSTLNEVQLIGSRCQECDEILFGKNSWCPNCGSIQIEEVLLSRRGVLWSYTTVNHRPPGKYKGADPFIPFGVGLVELPEGIRVLSIIDMDIDKLEIGLDLELVVFPYYKDSDGNEIIAFKFKPV